MTGSTDLRQKRNAQSRARRQRARDAIQGDEDWHGTLNGYCNHQCRCDACRSAYNTYSDEWRKRPDVAARRLIMARASSKQPHRLLARRAWNYGLTRQELTDLLAQGRCTACGTTDPGYHGWAIDHDHTCCPKMRSCGACVRGVLCRGCNMTLGSVNDNLDQLRSLVAYIERWEVVSASKQAEG